MAKKCGKQNLKNIIEEDISKIFGEPVHNNHLALCMLSDFLLVQFVLGPANCFVWIGVWEILDIIVSQSFTNAIICFVTGTLISTGLIAGSDRILLISHEIHKYSKFIFFLATRLISFFTCLVMVLFWKGWFDIWQHEDDNQLMKKHWGLSLGCLLLGSLLLASVGCMKTAAVTPPLGVWLDSGKDYLRIDKFYSLPEDPKNITWNFHIKNTCLTICIEVISLITYFGAWCLVDDLISHKEIYENYLNKIYQLLLAVFYSVVSYLYSVIYLYLHHNYNHIFSQSMKDMAYAVLLILATIATATHFHAWWGLADLLTEEYFDQHDPIPYVFLLGVGGSVLLVFGVSSTNTFGVEWEAGREEEGMLLPFFYLTFLLRNNNQIIEENQETK